MAFQDRFTYFHHDIIQAIEVDQDLDYVLNFASPASPARNGQFLLGLWGPLGQWTLELESTVLSL